MFTDWKTQKLLRYQFLPNWPVNTIQSQSKSQQVSIQIDNPISKCIWKYKGPKKGKIILKRTKLKDLYYLISGLIWKL